MTAAMGLLVVLYDQYEQQLSAANLRPLDDERAAFAEVRVRLEQDIAFLVKLEIQLVTEIIFAASIDMQPEIFAVREPIFLTGLERLVRLANDLELIVTKKIF